MSKLKHTYIHTYIHTCIHTYIHACMHAYIYTYIYIYTGPHPATSIALYKSLVEPYFRYCNAIWGQCGKSYINKLQTFHNRAARIVTRGSYEDAYHADHAMEVKGGPVVKKLVKITK